MRLFSLHVRMKCRSLVRMLLQQHVHDLCLRTEKWKRTCMDTGFKMFKSSLFSENHAIPVYMFYNSFLGSCLEERSIDSPTLIHAQSGHCPHPANRLWPTPSCQDPLELADNIHFLPHFLFNPQHDPLGQDTLQPLPHRHAPGLCTC